MVMFTLPTFAQNYQMRVSGFMAEDSWEAYDYVYGSPKGTDLLCVNKHDFITPMEYIDSLTMDENGRILRLATWQQFEGEWVYACYIDYTYNEMGLRTSRKNYNNFSGNFELGGTYYYNYDENGKMTDWKLDFMNIDPAYQMATLEYNEDGSLKKELIKQYNFSTYYIEDAYLTEYEYDENGNMTRSIEYFNDGTGTWVPQMYRVNEYDELGNCTLSQTTTATGLVQDKRIFTYDTQYLAENIYHYENPEDDFPILPQMKNLLKSFEYYAINDMNELVYVTDYLLNYEVIGGESVEEVAINSSIYPNPAQDYIMIESNDAEYVEVVDVYGRVVYSAEMNGSVKVNMSDFATGVYFVKLQANGETSVQKVVKD